MLDNALIYYIFAELMLDVSQKSIVFIFFYFTYIRLKANSTDEFFNPKREHSAMNCNCLVYVQLKQVYF